MSTNERDYNFMRDLAIGTEEINKDLEQRLALKDFEIHNLRQVLYYWREECTGFEPSISVFQLKVDKALSTSTNYDDLMAWHEAQLGEPVAWQALCKDSPYAYGASKINLDGYHSDFWQRPLYAKKG